MARIAEIVPRDGRKEVAWTSCHACAGVRPAKMGGFKVHGKIGRAAEGE